MALKRKIGTCFLCPPHSKAVPLTRGMCPTHYWLRRQQEKKVSPQQKNFVKNLLLNQNSQVNDNQHDVKTGFNGIIPTKDMLGGAQVYDPGKGIDQSDLDKLFEISLNTPPNPILQNVDNQNDIKIDSQPVLAQGWDGPRLLFQDAEPGQWRKGQKNAAYNQNSQLFTNQLIIKSGSTLNFPRLSTTPTQAQPVAVLMPTAIGAEVRKALKNNTPVNPILQIIDNQLNVNFGCRTVLPPLEAVAVGAAFAPTQVFSTSDLDNYFDRTKNTLVNQNLQPIENQALENLRRARISKKDQNANLILQGADFQTLNEWFLYHVSRADWVCENCKQPIITGGWQSKISCQAHILPKRDFPSVKLNRHNHLLLGGIFSDCSCHNRFDNSWEKARKMPVFELAISRFLSFKKYLSESEKNRLPEPFIKYI